MKKSLVIGGGNGVGLAVVFELLSRGIDKIVVFDKDGSNLPADPRIEYEACNLLSFDLSIFKSHLDSNYLFITAGFGRLSFFKDLEEVEIRNLFRVNAEAMILILKYFSTLLYSRTPFFCGIMGSISGLINSPLFSVYGATKSAVCSFVNSVNSELAYLGYANRITNASPGNIKGTRFDGAESTNLDRIRDFSKEFVNRTLGRDSLFIPDFDSIYSDVIRRSREDPESFGLESIRYKEASGRMNQPTRPQIKIGYLSGTFDLFHIGHLNMLKRAKTYCDYLVVGVHPDASHKGKQTFISLNERKEIVRSINCVDQVIDSLPEDADVYKNGLVHYDYLFVGSDYKGTERFARYEEYFCDKGVKIIYFPYTQGISSTQLRATLSK